MLKLNKLVFTVAGWAIASAAMASGGEATFAKVNNDNWKKECSACHLAYPPSMLPADSWKKMMSDLGNHFGEDASLDKVTADDITAFLTKYSGSSITASRKATRMAQNTGTPLRITETRYWIAKHDEINNKVYARPSIKSKSNCAACHQGAEKNDYSEDLVKIPK